MAENYYTILTNVGKAKIANAQVLGEKVVMTHLAVGDGDGMHYNPTENQTALRNEVWRGHIGSIDTDLENPNWIVLEATIPSNAGGFNVREVGIFDDEDNLIAIGKYPETYKPILTEGSAKDLYVRMIIEVTNAASVQLKIDPTIAMPSRKWVEEEIEKHAKTTASLTQRGHVQLSDDINSTSTTEAATPSAVKAINERLAAHLDNKMNPHSVTASQVGAIPVTEKGKANGVASLGSDGKVPTSQLSVTQPPDATTSRKGIVQLNNSITSTSSTQAATPYAVKQVNDKLTGDKLQLMKDSSANGSGSISIGDSAITRYNEAVAIGKTSTANGLASVAMGRGTVVLEDIGIAIGSLAESLGYKAIAIGGGAKAADKAGLAIGLGAKADDESDISIGSSAYTEAGSGIAIGNGARAERGQCVAIGLNAQSLNTNEIVLGGDSPFLIYPMDTIIPGDLRVKGRKNFEIPHPAPEKRDTHYIRHGAVESPTTGDTLYRYFIKFKGETGIIQLVGEDGFTTSTVTKIEHDGEIAYQLKIKLPDYWIYLNCNHQVFVNGNMHFKKGTGYIDEENEELILSLEALKPYSVVLFGTRNDDNVQDWYFKGVEREIGESWLGETYVFDVDEIIETEEMKEEVE